MKKILFILAVGLVFFAKADYIYWMVDNPASGTDISGADTTFNWANAVLTVQDSNSTYVNSTYDTASSAASGIGGKLSSDQASTLSDYGAYAYANIGSGYSGKYLLIELFSDTGSWMAGYSVSANDAAIARYIFSDNSMSIMPATGFGSAAANASYSVPEPTSGLLFLVGGVLLGLKRRREVV